MLHPLQVISDARVNAWMSWQGAVFSVRDNADDEMLSPLVPHLQRPAAVALQRSHELSFGKNRRVNKQLLDMHRYRPPRRRHTVYRACYNLRDYRLDDISRANEFL